MRSLEHGIVKAYQVKMRARCAKCAHVGRSGFVLCCSRSEEASNQSVNKQRYWFIFDFQRLLTLTYSELV